MSIRQKLRIVFSVLVLCLFAYTAIEAVDFSRRARYMPLYVSIAGVLFCAILIVLDWWRIKTASEQGSPLLGAMSGDYSAEPSQSAGDELVRFKRAGYYLSWIVGYIGGVAVVGLPVASAIFLASFLKIEGRMRIPGIALSVGVLLGGLYGITMVMHLHWPPNLLGW